MIISKNQGKDSTAFVPEFHRFEVLQNHWREPITHELSEKLEVKKNQRKMVSLPTNIAGRRETHSVLLNVGQHRCQAWGSKIFPSGSLYILY